MRRFLVILAAALTACSSPSAPSGDSTGDLIINEVVNAGHESYYGNAVEIYNPTSRSINLSNYKLKAQYGLINTDEGLFYRNSTLKIFDLPSLTIAPQAYVAIRSRGVKANESGGNTVYLDDSETPYSNFPYFSSDDGSVELLKSNTTVDFIRWGSSTSTPATGTFIGTVAAMSDDDSWIGGSWKRSKDHVNTSSASDWTTSAWSTLGGPNDVTTDADDDNDGIPDQAEASGSTFAGLDLYAMGARQNQKDIFIHIDYQVDGSVSNTDPGIIPQKGALDAFVAAFAAKGYHVHLDVGDLYGSGAANYNLDGRSHAVSYDKTVALGKADGRANAFKYKTDSMPLAKNKVFFYMLFANSQLDSGNGGSSGIANMPGNTSIITLGHWGLTTSSTAALNNLVNYQAGTMMHEFGHNLGLNHGGNEGENYKPNYFSTMNYLYQLDGLPVKTSDYDTRYYAQWNWASTVQDTVTPTLNKVWKDRANRDLWTDSYATTNFKIDYSDGSGSSINEASVNESAGIGRTGAGIDANNDGDAVDAAVNYSTGGLRRMLNPDLSDSTRKTLSDFDDWGKISTVFQRTQYGTWSGAGPRSLIENSQVSLMRSILAENQTTSEPCLNPFTRNPQH